MLVKEKHQMPAATNWIGRLAKNPQFTFPNLHQDDKNFKFLKTLECREKEYLYDHVHKYATVTKTTTQEQFERVIEYACTFLTEPSDMEQRILKKALQFL